MTPQQRYNETHNQVTFDIIIEKELKTRICDYLKENNMSVRTWLIQKIEEELNEENR